MDEKISKLFLPLLDKLYNTEPAGEPFRKPVDVVKYGCFDYYLYVKHPIDLSTIREKLLNHRYKSDAWRFIADIQLMFSNAYLFNKKGTPVYEFTNKLNKIWNQELTPIMQRLNYCCGTLHKFGPQLLFCHGTTLDKYCQIPIGAKYKCYEDQYSFCIPCFNKIDTDYFNIQDLSCETSRMKLPTQPVKKSDFNDCTNDDWQYEYFIQCTQCSRRVHQICDLHPAEDTEIDRCIQHAQLEIEQKSLCQVPEEYRDSQECEIISSDTSAVSDTTEFGNSTQNQIETQANNFEAQRPKQQNQRISERKSDCSNNNKASQNTVSQAGSSEAELIIDESDLETTSDQFFEPDQENLDDQVNTNSENSPTSLDDELLQFARDVDDSDLTNSAPASPNSFESAKDNCHRKLHHQSNNNSNIDRNYQSESGASSSSRSSCVHPNGNSSSVKNSVDKIAARLSINKLSAEIHSDDIQRQYEGEATSRDKFVCNHCYRKRKIGFNLRHRKYSARRLPHTRMSRYIETKVNEHIRENSPMAGEVTVRVLTAYRDTILVKPEMKNYVQRSRQSDSPHHPNLKDYPEEFAYTNRAIFAWQEIDGVDVCVFGMHVQEYGEDCPEPNRQVVYLSYLDSVHFFRPKQVRTAVYHEILLSYFKYVKKLGFRRVFIWVCPSRKGDDYIFNRHPTEQKMPTLKRLSDWYINLLDKGVMAGIVERHQNIYQYAGSQNWSSILSMPYLSGDYWPGEFERLLKIMIESQREYQAKLSEKQNGIDPPRSLDTTEISNYNMVNGIGYTDRKHEQSNLFPLNGMCHKQPPNSRNGNILNLNTKTSLINSLGLRASDIGSNDFGFSSSGDYCNVQMKSESKYYRTFTPDSLRSDLDQPLDLSKNSSTGSPDSFFDDDLASEISFKSSNNRKKRRKSNTMGYSKKRSRTSSSQVTGILARSSLKNHVFENFDASLRYSSQPLKTCRRKSSIQSQRDPLETEVLLTPGEELVKNLERSLKRQKEGFIVARLNDCDCSPHFESQRRKEEVFFTCDLMKGREPFLQLARLKNYEFSTLRRAKFSSLAMVKHLSQSFKLEPICNECFSIDSSKRHYACSHCEDYYLCTSCHENTHHDHIMSLMAPSNLPDIDEFLQQCSLASTTNSISSASSTISNKSFNESILETPSQSVTPTIRRASNTTSSTPLNRHPSDNPFSSSMPLSCQRQKNRDFKPSFRSRTEDEENANVCSFNTGTKLTLPDHPSPPPSHSGNSIRNVSIELDQVLVENFIRHAEVSHDVDFDQMKNESKKLLTHYWGCPMKETCHKCKFVVLSCSFMSVLMRSTRLQMLINCNSSEMLSNTNSNGNHPSGINLTTAHQFGYQPKDK